MIDLQEMAQEWEQNRLMEAEDYAYGGYQVDTL